jgi:hypothetical protein
VQKNCKKKAEKISGPGKGGMGEAIWLEKEGL